MNTGIIVAIAVAVIIPIIFAIYYAEKQRKSKK